MGGAVSTGRNNDDLVDNLVTADYIRTPFVQKLFRAVDRADYFLPHCRSNAYKDLAWKSGNLHLSAPCIYSEVMEGLCLKPNLSFLNLGSGTGYLSTMVGLALGSGGINHGVEIYLDVIQYAYTKLEEFKRFSCSIDEYDLCEPRFIQGNCLCLSSSTFQYDRVYCGGACPATYITYMKNLIKVGGILVMPIEDQLMQIERTSENTWEERSLLPVSFATLMLPEAESLEIVTMLDMEPSSLQELCRTVVRNVLRDNINKEFPKLKVLPKRKRISKRKHQLKRSAPPHLDTSDDGSEGDEAHTARSTRSFCPRNDFENRSIGAFIDIVLGRLPDQSYSLFDSAASSEPNASSDSVEFENNTENDTNHDSESDIQNSQDNDNNHDSEIETSNAHENGVHQFLTAAHLDTLMSDISSRVAAIVEEASQNLQEPDINNTGNGAVIARITLRKRGHRDEGIEEDEENSEEGSITEDATTSSNISNKVKPSEIPSATKTKREKFDSGLGDEIVSNSPTGGEAADEIEDSDDIMDIDSIYNSDKVQLQDPTNELSETGQRHWRTITVPSFAVDHLFEPNGEEDIPGNETDSVPNSRPILGPYTLIMRNKIQELPLPQTLKRYLNYYKEF